MVFLRGFGKNSKVKKVKGDGMRHGQKGFSAQQGDNQIIGMDFRNSIQKEESSSMIEMASEFGLTTKDVRKLKKHLERS